jgi:hypothetical protein
MNYRAACALALLVYALVVFIGAVSGHMSPVPFAEFDIPRSIGAVLLAFGVLLRARAVDVLAVAYVVWLGIWGLLSIIGLLYQFLVPFGGQRILPDQVRIGVALSSELALFAAAMALLRGNAIAYARARGEEAPFPDRDVQGSRSTS